jgi:hypothetical protein
VLGVTKRYPNNDVCFHCCNSNNYLVYVVQQYAPTMYIIARIHLNNDLCPYCFNKNGVPLFPSLCISVFQQRQRFTLLQQYFPVLTSQSCCLHSFYKRLHRYTERPQADTDGPVSFSSLALEREEHLIMF